MVPPFEKVTKKKKENNLLHFCFTLRKCFVLVMCRHFTFKVVKFIKIEPDLLKIGQSHDAKNHTRETVNVYAVGVL